MLKFVIALLGAAAESGAAAFVLRKVFGHAALRDSVMHGLYVLLGLGLFLKTWLDTAPIQWFAIDFMLIFLLSVVYRGDMKKQALIAAGLAIAAVGLDAAVKLLLLPML